MTGPAGMVDRTVHVAEVMGTVASIDIRDQAPALVRQAAARAATAELIRFDRRFSSYRPDSEVRRFDRGDIGVEDLSDQMRHVRALSRELADASGGVFSVVRPDTGELDVAGVVKGWSIDRAGEVLRELGLRHWCLNLGGDVLTSGSPQPGRRWRVAVRDPRSADRVSVVLEVLDAAVATSGTYERGAHIWHGRTGLQPALPGSTTVVGPRMVYADAYATIAHALGADGLRWIQGRPDYSVLRIDSAGRTASTIGITVFGDGDLTRD